jgi:hypothetical protein
LPTIFLIAFILFFKLVAAKGDKENESSGEGLGNQIEENVSKSSAEQPKNNTSTVSPSSSFPLSTTTSKRNELRGEIVKEKLATGLEIVTQSPVSGSSPSPPTVSETRLTESSPTAPAQPIPSKNDNETYSTAIEKPDLNSVSETTSLSTRKTDKENGAVNSSSTTLETGNQDRPNISVTMQPLHPNNNSSGNTSTKRPSTAASATVASTKPGYYTPAQVSNITNISVPISSSINAKNETGATTYSTTTTISEDSTLQEHASSSTMSVPSELSSASTQSTPEQTMKPANTTNATGQDTTVATNLAPWSVSTEGEPTNQTKSPTSSTATSTPPNNITGTEASATPSSQSISNYHNTTSSTVTTKTTISTRNESTTAVTKPIPEPTTSTPKLTSPKSSSTTTTTTKSPPAVVPPVTETEKTTTKSTTTTTTTTTIAPNVTTTPKTTATTQKSTNISKVTTEKPKENHTTTRSTNVENAGSATTAAFASLGTVIILVLVALVVVMIYMRRKDHEW